MKVLETCKKALISRGRRGGRLPLTAAAAVIGLFAWGDVVISDNMALSSTLTLDVPAGETWTYSGVISGSSGIVKNGGGTLCLTGANTFTGGIVVNEGSLDTSSATVNGWGTGTVTVNSTGTKVCRVVVRNSESAPIHFTGPTTDACEGIYVEKRTSGTSTLGGAITADGNLYVKTFGSDTSSDKDTTRLQFNGTVTVASPGRLALAPHCKVEFRKLVTANVLEGYWAANTATEDGGNPGVVKLCVASNKITRIVLDRTRVQAGIKHAIAGSIIEWTGLHPEGGSLDIAGCSIVVKGLVTPAGITQFAGTPYEKSFAVENTGNSTATFELIGAPADYTGYARFGNMRVSVGVIPPSGTTARLHLYGRRHSLNRITFSRVTYLEGDMTFENPFDLNINNAASVYLNTTNPRSFCSLTGFGLSSCNLYIQSADTLASIPDDYTITISTTANSHIYLPDAGSTLRVKSIYDGASPAHHLAAGTWTKDTPGTPLDTSGVARLTRGTFIAATPVAEPSSITWTAGAGADTSVGTAANWGLENMPNLGIYGVSATVPTANPVLTFPAGDTLLTALAINPARPTDGGTSTSVFEAADATARLLLQENGLSFASHGEQPCTYVYNLSVPTYLTGTSSLVFSSNDVVNVSGSLRGRGKLNIDLGGSHNNVKNYAPGTNAENLETTGGVLNLAGNNAFDGDVTVSNGVVNVSGTLGVTNDSGTFTLGANYRVTSGDENWVNYGCAVFSNATVNKKYVGNALGQGGAYKNAATWQRFAGTNVMNGFVHINASHYAVLLPGANVTFAGGYTADNAFALMPPTVSGSSAKVTFTGPWKGGNASKSHFYAGNQSGSLHVVFACKGSYSPRYFDLYGANNFFECTVDDAITAPYLYLRSSGTLSLTNCTVRFPCFYSDTSAVLTGSDGGCLEITSGWTSADVDSRLYRGKIQGDLTLRMSGQDGNRQRLSGCVATSCGDVEVTGGTLQFDADSSWLVGTNVTVRGTGTLAINSANTFNEEFAVVHFEDGGKIDVPAGVAQKFAEGWVDGVKLPPNRYTAANLPAHVSGAGAIIIAGQGMMILFR